MLPNHQPRKRIGFYNTATYKQEDTREGKSFQGEENPSHILILDNLTDSFSSCFKWTISYFVTYVGEKQFGLSG